MPAASASQLPALIDQLPGDATRAAQTEFTRARQVAFIENLATTGSVRSAATAGRVSHQTAYRARRANPAFRLAWDAALVAALAAAEEVLACRAIEGVEEQVWYHGEVVATRRRYDARLLLAHLARLDRLTANDRVAAFAGDFDVALDRFAQGLEQPECAADSAAAGQGGNSGPGLCNTRSMSAPEEAPPPPEWCPFEQAMVPRLQRRLNAMDVARPADAPPLVALGDPDAVEAEQLAAFEEGVECWWLVVPPGPQDDPALWQFCRRGGECRPEGAQSAVEQRQFHPAMPGADNADFLGSSA